MSDSTKPVIPDSVAAAEVATIELAAIEAGAPKDGDVRAEKEQEKIEQDRDKAIARQRSQLLNQGLAADISNREKYANRIFYLIVAWLIAILGILLLHGILSKRDIVLNFVAFDSHWRTAIHFELSDPVLLALIGGTTASVLGLFVIVANYFFSKK